jgi:hypothetical protein
MKNIDISNNKKTDDEIRADMKLLSEKVKQNVTITPSLFPNINLGEEDLDTNFEKEILNTSADPEKSHRLYYTMMMTMRVNLPKANKKRPITPDQQKKNKEIKIFNKKIYAEKSLFLNRGKDRDNRGIRGSDERQTYIPNFLTVAYDVVHNWVANGSNPYDLFFAFYELNKERGYRK